MVSKPEDKPVNGRLLLPKAYHPFIAGALAAVIEISVMQPMDVIKTRYQLQSATLKHSEAKYPSVLSAAREIVKKEGWGVNSRTLSIFL